MKIQVCLEEKRTASSLRWYLHIAFCEPLNCFRYKRHPHFKGHQAFCCSNSFLKSLGNRILTREDKILPRFIYWGRTAFKLMLFVWKALCMRYGWDGAVGQGKKQFFLSSCTAGNKSKYHNPQCLLWVSVSMH